jgi:tetratricopeptide (TPR) repeat protein
MQQIHFIQKLYNKFFPQSFARGLKLTNISNELENLPIDEKKKLANTLITKAEEILSKEDLSAIKLFNEAAQLDPSNPLIWYRQGLAFFEFGCQTNKEKSLLLASKNFKIAVSLDSEIFDFWWAWGNVLFVLGNQKNEYHYFLEAKKKYKHAVALSQNQPDDILSELHWDNALIYTHIADHSGEAIDLKKAIEEFHKSLSYQKDAPAAFWNDLGNAYLKMGYLINENNIYLQAIDYFTTATQKSKKFVDAWSSIAQSYSQLYINTLDENYFNLANQNYEIGSEISPLNGQLWLDWANLLGESGRINKDTKKLRASIEKCIRAKRRNKNTNQIIGQWVESLALLGAYTNRLDLIIEAENRIMKATDLYSDDSDLWYSYGICMNAFAIYYDDIDYNQFAVEKFQIGLSLNRTNPELWSEIASSHSKMGKELEDIDMLERSIKFFAKAIDLKPACPYIIFDYAKALTFLAELTLNQKTIEEAIKQFEIALSLQKNAILSHPDWIFYYGSALDILGDLFEKESYYLKAIEIFNNVLLVNPDYPKIHFKLALCFSHLLEVNSKTEYFEKANNCFKLASKQDSEDENVWLEWGLALITYAYENFSDEIKKQYYLEAEQKIIKSGQLGNQHAHYNLACLYSLTNRFDEAINFLEKSRIQNMLPPIEEMLDDDWLDNLRTTELFSNFLHQIEKKQNI